MNNPNTPLVTSQLHLFPSTQPQVSLGLSNSKLSPTTPSLQPFTPRHELSQSERRILHEYERLVENCGVGATISIYPSGEISGACTNFGPRQNQPRIHTKRKNFTTELSHPAKKNIKRAVENHTRNFNRFLTFTFSPDNPRNTFNDDGTICHTFAHHELSRILEALTLLYRRKADKLNRPHANLNYIWVAELQKNGNIHFHLLIDQHIPISILNRLWRQSSNSVDIQVLRKPERAISYFLNYMKKSKGDIIYGKRYGMSQSLYTTMKPTRITIKHERARQLLIEYMNDNFTDIIADNGYKCDWGFNLPKPSRQTGKVSPYHQRQFITGLAELLADHGFPELLTHLQE